MTANGGGRTLVASPHVVRLEIRGVVRAEDWYQAPTRGFLEFTGACGHIRRLSTLATEEGTCR